MANDKKFVVKNGLTAQNLSLVDAIDNATYTISASMSGNTLSFTGTNGQLFSITDSAAGTIFSVNDISGIPSIEVDDDGTIRLAEIAGNVLIGSDSDDGSSRLQVSGNVIITGTLNGGTPWTSVNDGASSGLDADLLDGQQGSYYRINVYDASGTLLN